MNDMNEDLQHQTKSTAEKRIHTVSFVGGMIAGAAAGWLVWGMQAQVLVVMGIGAIFGMLAAESVTGKPASTVEVKFLVFRQDPPWPFVRRWAGYLFLVCLAAVTLFIPEKNQAKAPGTEGISVFLGGLALAAGAVHLFSLRGPWRSGWMLAFVFSVLLISASIMFMLGVKEQSKELFLLIAGGMTIVATGIAIRLNRLFEDPSDSRK